MKSVSVLLWLLSGSIQASQASQGVREQHEFHVDLAKPSTPLTPPSRPLVWGDINFMHTTDSHGWLLGHQKASFPEPNYSGDLGDLASFISHMKHIAAEKDVDLLLVDSGDLHDGTGLTDGYPPGGVNAHDSNEFLKQIPYDIMTIGNHELYVYANAYDMYTNFAPKVGGYYLTSNVNITVFDEHHRPTSVPVGERCARFRTKKGRSVTSFGILFNFKGNTANTTVQPVKDMVRESWFLEAITDEPDLFLLVGHMPVAKDPGHPWESDWAVVLNAIRKVHLRTPVAIFGGHSHIRDCVQLDDMSMSLASGRYLETVGWMSLKLDQTNKADNVPFSRRYLDANRVAYQYHTGTSDSTFDTLHGLDLTKGLKGLARRFNLDHLYGFAPHDFTMDRAPYPSEDSSLTLYSQKAVPFALALNNTRSPIPNFIITNSGSQRFDIYKGPFTKNDLLTTSPFIDSFVYIPNITYALAQDLLTALNKNGELIKEMELDSEVEARLDDEDVEAVYRKWMKRMNDQFDFTNMDSTVRTPGYVTRDSCPGLGDDTPHYPLPQFDVPPFISSKRLAKVRPMDTLDLVFARFISKQVVLTLNSLQSQKHYTMDDVTSYNDVLSNTILGLYAQEAWN